MNSHHTQRPLRYIVLSPLLCRLTQSSREPPFISDMCCLCGPRFLCCLSLGLYVYISSQSNNNLLQHDKKNALKMNSRSWSNCSVIKSTCCGVMRTRVQIPTPTQHARHPAHSCNIRSEEVETGGLLKVTGFPA